jgi:L,D-transpeptidase catalytic domain
MRTRAGRRELNRAQGSASLLKLLALLLITADSLAGETKADVTTSGPAASTAEPQVLAQSWVQHQVPSQCQIIVSLVDRKLMLLENGRLSKVYPVAVGTRNTPSPEGQFTVVSRVTSPTWYHRGKVVPPGSSNPLGTRWIGLSLKGYGIHGTNAPSSIGHAASHGCIRMRRSDLEELFRTIRPGDAVEIRRATEAQLGSAASDVAQAEPRVRDARVGTAPQPASASATRAAVKTADAAQRNDPAVNSGAGL